MKPDRKPQASKLDPFAAELLALDADGKKLPEIRQWLAEKGVSADTGTISRFLTSQRTDRMRQAKRQDDYWIAYDPKLKKKLDAMRLNIKGARRKRKRDGWPRKLRGGPLVGAAAQSAARRLARESQVKPVDSTGTP